MPSDEQHKPAEGQLWDAHGDFAIRGQPLRIVEVMKVDLNPLLRHVRVSAPWQGVKNYIIPLPTFQRYFDRVK